MTILVEPQEELKDARSGRAHTGAHWRTSILAVAISVAIAGPAVGQDLVSGPVEARLGAAGFATPVPPQPPLILTGRAAETPAIAPAKRPAALSSLYVTAGALQVMDLYTTSRGLEAGAYETNAAIRTGNAGTAIALKAATTGLGILIAEKMWRKNKLGAILSMVAANAITSAAVINNYGVIRTLERR